MSKNKRILSSLGLVLCYIINISNAKEDNGTADEIATTTMRVASKFNCYHVGEDIDIIYANSADNVGPTTKRNWVGIYKTDNQRGAVKWQWTCPSSSSSLMTDNANLPCDDETDFYDSKTNVGSVSFRFDSESRHRNAVLEPGMYFIYLHGGFNSGSGRGTNNSSVMSTPFWILGGNELSDDQRQLCGFGNNHVHVDKSSYVVGDDDTINVTFDRAYPQQGDWVGLYPIPSRHHKSHLQYMFDLEEQDFDESNNVWKFTTQTMASSTPSSQQPQKSLAITLDHGIATFDVEELLSLSSSTTKLDGRLSYVEYKAVLGKKTAEGRFVPLVHTKETFTVVIPKSNKPGKTSNLRVSM